MAILYLIVAAIIIYIAVKFFSSLDKDNTDLNHLPLPQKFSVLIEVINDFAFRGEGKITVHDKREFNLYKTRENQIIHFLYSTGNLTVIWKYKYFQKEIVHERIFRGVRNLSIFEQEKIGKQLIEEIRIVISNHKNAVSNVDTGITPDLYKNAHSKGEKEYITLTLLANKLNTGYTNVEDKYKKELESDSYSLSELEELILMWRGSKSKESTFFNIPTEDTPAAFLEKWSIEYKQNIFKS